MVQGVGKGYLKPLDPATGLIANVSSKGSPRDDANRATTDASFTARTKTTN